MWQCLGGIKEAGILRRLRLEGIKNRKYQLKAQQVSLSGNSQEKKHSPKYNYSKPWFAHKPKIPVTSEFFLFWIENFRLFQPRHTALFLPFRISF